LNERGENETFFESRNISRKGKTNSSCSKEDREEARGKKEKKEERRRTKSHREKDINLGSGVTSKGEDALSGKKDRPHEKC